MLHGVCYITMPVGNSGRIVIEVDPEFKREFRDALEKDNVTLKEWFLKEARRYMQNQVQPSLFAVAESPPNHTSSDRKNSS